MFLISNKRSNLLYQNLISFEFFSQSCYIFIKMDISYIPIAGMTIFYFFFPFTNSFNLSINAFPLRFFPTIRPSLSRTKI